MFSKQILILKRLATLASLFLFTGLLGSCASYQSNVSPAREKLEAGQIDAALEELRVLAEKPSDDQLVYLLDYGTALQYAGKTQESSKVFLKADKLADMQDYHSVSKLAGSLLFAQELVQYKGDTFEQIFINAFLALNFISEGKLDDAIVEARRINEKYQRLRQDEKKKFELNPFSKYLSAVLWEAGGNYDDAYIAYNEAYKLDLGSEILKKDLIRSALMARRDDEFQKWKTQFPEVAKDFKKPAKEEGEIVVFFLQGWGPRKVPDPQEYRFPKLVHVPSDVNHLELKFTKEGSNYQATTKSQNLYSVEQAAIDTLMEDRGILLAKRVAGIVAKEVAADQIRQKNELLGAIAWIGMHASDRADVRQWSLLPENIQIIRQTVPAGKYYLAANAIGNGGNTLEDLGKKEVVVTPGRKAFVVLRSLK